MKGVEFPEANTKLLPPEGQESRVYALHVWRHPDGGMLISKWGMTWRERLFCLWGGYIWFHCWGNTHPPMSIETSYPFERDKVPIGIRRSIIFVVILALLVLAGTCFLYFSEIS